MSTVQSKGCASEEATATGCSSVGTVEQLSATSCCDEQHLCKNAVRERAYLLWEKAGYPSGDGSNFWYEAEEQLRSEE